MTQRLQGIVNGYGPTETTILSTLWPVDAACDRADPHRPPDRQHPRLRARDDRTEASVGEPGELFIAGAGVARGYCGDDELTAAAFVPDPRGRHGDRMYRTGDRCRWRSDGNLEYLGRTDSQVKIRGQRVELGEVEAGIEMFAPVGAAVAVVARARSDGLRGAHRPGRAADTGAGTRTRRPHADLRDGADHRHRAGRVPADRKRQDRSGALATAAASTAPAPEPAPETGDAFTTEICALIQEVLGADRVGPADDFFDVGGHSLAVMRVAAAIAQKWKVEVASDVFYDTETVADLAAAVNALRAAP